MQHRNRFRSSKLAAASCLLLAFTTVLALTRPAEAQSSAANQDNQAPTIPANSILLSGHMPQKVLDGTAFRVGRYNPEQKLRLALAIQPPHMVDEEKFIKDLTTKGSPSFHKFLSQSEWNTRFAPTAENEQAVVDWAQSQGLIVTHRYPNRLLVDVEGTANTIEKAFGVIINSYRVGDEVDFSNDREPVIPARLSGIVRTVVGLNNVERVHRIGSVHATVKGADYVPGPIANELGSAHGDGDSTKAVANRATLANLATATNRAAATNPSAAATKPTSNDSYPLDNKNGVYAADPENIQSSEGYDFNALQKLSFCCNEPNNSAGSPPESSIALVGYGGFNTSDTNTFFSAYGMAWNITWYCLGGSACPAADGEAPLDVEYAGAMANSYGSYLNTAHIYEYEMTNNLYTTYADTFNQIVSDDHAKVVSTSYGWEENVGFSGTQATGTMHPIFNNMVGTGWTLIAASGDNGASDGCVSATAVDYPSSDPDFLAAGGTQLQLNDSGIFSSETAWQGESWSGACGSNHGGSTGGVSTLFAAPYWQSSIESPYYEWIGSQEYVVTGNTHRMVPDISLTANPDVMGEWYYSGGSWQSEGGTSIVAPELAGFFAQENSYLDYVGNVCGSGSSACSPVGLASPFIYYDAIDGAPHNPFYDMTSGCNNNDVTAADGLVYYCAGTGYDPVTGWGSANMLQLAWGINWELIPAYGKPSLSFGGPTTSHWYNSDQLVTWTLSDAGSGNYPAPGPAGYTLGWDSLPSDPHSEPHGGDGNSFYAGPQHPFSTFGCVDFSGALCQAASGQGCHTVYVEGWDNQGNTTTGSYGPVCYDSVVPVVSASTYPTTSASVWVNKPVLVTLAASDPGGSKGSGILKTYFAVNTGACTPGNLGACSIYSGPFTISSNQRSYVYYFTEDNAGNFSPETYIWVSIDETAPVATASLSGTTVAGGYKSPVQVGLSATDTGGSGVAKIYYSLNGGSTLTYGAPFTVSTLGSNTVKYWAVDAVGNIAAAKTVTFSIFTPTTATLVATPNPVLFGGSVKLTATVKATISGIPTGSVTFLNGATKLGIVVLTNGVATLTTTALPAGVLTLQVSYAGAGYFLATNSAPFDETVREGTTTTISSSLNPAAYKQSVTITAHVSPTHSGTPTGTVRFYAGGAFLGTGTLNSSDVATFTTSFLPGSFSLTGVYTGDSTYVSSSSPALIETVTQAAQTITFATIPAQLVGAKITLTATASSGLAVSFSSSTPKVCTVTGNIATMLAVGNCTITATQVGNADYKAAPAVTQTFTVKAS
jgi:hypothetical protein